MTEHQLLTRLEQLLTRELRSGNAEVEFFGGDVTLELYDDIGRDYPLDCYNLTDIAKKIMEEFSPMFSDKFRTRKDAADHDQRMHELGVIVKALGLDPSMPLPILRMNLVDALDLIKQELENR